jgi:hypothetical protein
MSNEIKTAVDLMFQKAMLVLPMGSIDARQALKETYQQAKEMDKERLTDAYCDGKANGMDISHPLSLTKEISANEWYEQTYGGNK